MPVTTIGAPFYSNWGLTDDRQKVSRRQKKLSIEELFAGSYLIYPKYINPYNGNELDLEEVIGLINS
ncbi:capsular polysaccharide export protein, LipB/KpsS family [Bacillus sp. m3-13]|uniref:capsular polysaccharide export protein, LipB/KpsS family n=1 Tax=Bacillus sp. m3-13 TaxID=406124 RepID=UPI0012F6E7FB